MYRVSPSGIGMLLECPRCLWYHYNESYERPRGIFPSLPGGMDEVLKVYFDEHRAHGTLPPEIDGKIDGTLFTDRTKLDQWRNNRIGIKAEFPEYDMLLKGAIDDLLVDPAGKLIIFDFKTRGYPTKSDSSKYYVNQLNLYALLFSLNGFEVADTGYLLFFWPDSYGLGQGQFATDLMSLPIDAAKGKETLRAAHGIITGSLPPAANDCVYCAYRTRGLAVESKQTLL